jgi:hypothetical protein
MRRPPWLYIVWCLCSCRVACPHSPAAWPHSAVSLAAVLLRLMLWSEPVFVGGVCGPGWAHCLAWAQYHGLLLLVYNHQQSR